MCDTTLIYLWTLNDRQEKFKIALFFIAPNHNQSISRHLKKPPAERGLGWLGGGRPACLVGVSEER